MYHIYASLLQAQSLFLSRHGLEKHECADATGTIMSEIVARTRWAETTRINKGRGHAAARRTYTARSTARGIGAMLREARTRTKSRALNYMHKKPHMCS